MAGASRIFGFLDKPSGIVLALCRIWAIGFSILGAVSMFGNRSFGSEAWYIDLVILIVWWVVTGYMLIGRDSAGLRVAVYLAAGLLFYIVGVISVGYWLVFIRQIPGRTGSDMLCAALVGLPAFLPLVLTCVGKM